MAVKTVAHVNFRGEARAALDFYAGVFGGTVALVTHAQAYGTTAPEEAELVSWGQVVSPAGFAVMAFDVPPALPFQPGENAFFVSVRGDTPDEIASYWTGLSDGASIIQPLAASGWAQLYGMLKDRFGVVWVLDVPAQRA